MSLVQSWLGRAALKSCCTRFGEAFFIFVLLVVTLKRFFVLARMFFSSMILATHFSLTTVPSRRNCAVMRGCHRCPCSGREWSEFFPLTARAVVDVPKDWIVGFAIDY
jgi:hypothetical protein